MDAARRMGSRDHYKLNLELNEIDEDRLFAISRRPGPVDG